MSENKNSKMENAEMKTEDDKIWNKICDEVQREFYSSNAVKIDEICWKYVKKMCLDQKEFFQVEENMRELLKELSTPRSEDEHDPHYELVSKSYKYFISKFKVNKVYWNSRLPSYLEKYEDWMDHRKWKEKLRELPKPDLFIYADNEKLWIECEIPEGKGESFFNNTLKGKNGKITYANKFQDYYSKFFLVIPKTTSEYYKKRIKKILNDYKERIKKILNENKELNIKLLEL